MGKNKRLNGADDLYVRHLTSSRFASNPNNNRNAIIQRMYERILTELAINRFKWTGFPDSVDVRFLELTEFYYALCVFYFDKDYDKYFALRGGSTSFLNMLDNPTAFTVIGNNFVSKTISAKHAVPIWANYLRVPDLDIVQVYARRFAELDRTIEINGLNARRSKVIITPDNQRLSAINVNRELDEGTNGIQLAANGITQDMAFIQALDLGVHPDAIEKLHIVRTRLWNECMGLLGIENANQDKKERLVAAEVAANDDQTSMMRFVNLNARREAAERINKMFPDLNVSVEYHTDAMRRATMQAQNSMGIGEVG